MRRRPSILGMIGLASDAAEDGGALEADGLTGEDQTVMAMQAAVGRRLSTSAGRRLSNVFGGRDEDDEGAATIWSLQLRHARQALELRGVRDCIRLLREMVATAAVEVARGQAAVRGVGDVRCALSSAG